MRARFPGIPELTLDGLSRYFNQRVLPGGFLTACLCNYLTQAFERADPWNFAALQQIVGALRTCAPAQAWGSQAAVNSWLDGPKALAKNP